MYIFYFILPLVLFACVAITHPHKVRNIVHIFWIKKPNIYALLEQLNDETLVENSREIVQKYVDENGFKFEKEREHDNENPTIQDFPDKDYLVLIVFLKNTKPWEFHRLRNSGYWVIAKENTIQPREKNVLPITPIIE